MALACEVKLRNGTSCGVDADGRCGRCEKAYCTSHRDYYRSGLNRPAVVVCTECVTALEDIVRNSHEIEARLRSDLNARIRAAASALASRSGLGQIRRRSTVHTTGSLWWQKEHYDEYAPCWPVGTFDWHYSETQQRGSGNRPTATGVTAAGEIVPVSVPHSREQGVRKVGDGDYVGGGTRGPSERHWTLGELEQIATALERKLL